MNAYETFEDVAVSDFFKVENLYEFRGNEKKKQKEFTEAIERLIHSLEVVLMEQDNNFTKSFET